MHCGLGIGILTLWISKGSQFPGLSTVPSGFHLRETPGESLQEGILASVGVDFRHERTAKRHREPSTMVGGLCESVASTNRMNVATV